MAFRIVMCALLAQVQLPFPNLDIRRDIAETPTEVFILGPAKHVAAGYVESAEFSIDDKLLAFVTKSPSGFTINLWDRATGRASKIVDTAHKPDLTFQAHNQTLWITTDPQDGTSSQILRFDGRARTLRSFEAQGANWRVEPSPFNDGVFLFKGWGPDRVSMIYHGGQVVAFTKPADGDVQLTWEFGAPAGYLFTRNGQRGGTPHAIDMRTGTIGAPIAAQPLEFPAPSRKARIARARVKLGGTTINGVWLEHFSGHAFPAPEVELNRQPSMGDPLKALIAADQRSATLGSSETIVAFWDRHNLFIREVKPMQRSAFDKLYDNLEREALMSQAKQVGIASMIYAADADDFLPINDGSMDRLVPYLKDASLLDGFQYVLNGQNLKDMKNPGETILGRVNGRNGRAIVYADGRVIWDPKLKP